MAMITQNLTSKAGRSIIRNIKSHICNNAKILKKIVFSNPSLKNLEKRTT